MTKKITVGYRFDETFNFYLYLYVSTLLTVSRPSNEIENFGFTCDFFTNWISSTIQVYRIYSFNGCYAFHLLSAVPSMKPIRLKTTSLLGYQRLLLIYFEFQVCFQVDICVGVRVSFSSTWIGPSHGTFTHLTIWVYSRMAKRTA